eukprot:11213443-Lingulodinium_polyedra.AAC.1
MLSVRDGGDERSRAEQSFDVSRFDCSSDSDEHPRGAMMAVKAGVSSKASPAVVSKPAPVAAGHTSTPMVVPKPP